MTQQSHCWAYTPRKPELKETPSTRTCCCSVASDSLQHHGLQHTRPPCSSPAPRAYSQLMFIKSVMPSNHLVLCRSLLVLPSIFPRVFTLASTLIPGANSLEKTLMLGKTEHRTRRQKGMTEDEMAGWHYQLNGHESEQTLGDNEGQGSLVCCSSRTCKELDMTE